MPISCQYVQFFSIEIKVKSEFISMQAMRLMGIRTVHTVILEIGHILRRNCLLQQVIEGKIKGHIEVTRRRGWRRKKLLDDLKDRRGYCKLKEEALDRTMWRNRFGREFGPVVWQVTDCDDVQYFSIEIKVKSEFISMQAMKFMGIRTVDTVILEIGGLWRCGVSFTPLSP